MNNDFGRRRSARTRLCAAAMALAVSVPATSGCGSESRAVQEPTVDLTKLDTGSYATKPVQVTAPDAIAAGRLAEALRLGGAMPLPMEIDPALTTNAGGVRPFTSVSDLLVPEMRGGKTAFGWLNDMAFRTDPTGFTAGFATSARTDSDADLGYQLTVLVMTFDSDSDAAAAATVFAADGFPDFGNGIGEPAQSTAHPDALLSWLPGSQYLAGFYPTGRFVIGTLVDNREKYWEKISDLPDLIAKSDKAIAVAEDRLKSFRPTPPDQLTTLPLDPLGMVRLTLPRPAGDRTKNAFSGALDAHSALHDEGKPDTAQALFDKDGVDAVGYGAGALYRTRDAAAARDLRDLDSVDKFHHPIDSPVGLPVARCMKYRGPDTHAFPFVCAASYGRFVAQVWSQQQQDVFQRISAQYAMLANDK
ncbi:hypothetical protein ACFXO9_21840 [Nocardia tengchongensis]|uniref:DUF7373 family lipoprotein n=1 Tax=Nocardia tengchongensis TaxID=2055889 RepID=UPI0036A2628D